MLTLEWRPRAHLDRESIAIYLGLERNDPQAALSTIKSIDAALENTCEFPDSGGHFRMGGISDKEYRTVHVNPYTVYYRYDHKTLTVYRILHQRQNIDTYALIDLPRDF